VLDLRPLACNAAQVVEILPRRLPPGPFARPLNAARSPSGHSPAKDAALAALITRAAYLGRVIVRGIGNGNLDGGGAHRYINEEGIALEIGFMASAVGAAQDLNHYEIEA
jgi:hypothetical protein